MLSHRTASLRAFLRTRWMWLTELSLRPLLRRSEYIPWMWSGRRSRSLTPTDRRRDVLPDLPAIPHLSPGGRVSRDVDVEPSIKELGNRLLRVRGIDAVIELGDELSANTLGVLEQTGDRPADLLSAVGAPRAFVSYLPATRGALSDGAFHLRYLVTATPPATTTAPVTRRKCRIPLLAIQYQRPSAPGPHPRQFPQEPGASCAPRAAAIFLRPSDRSGGDHYRVGGFGVG